MIKRVVSSIIAFPVLAIIIVVGGFPLKALMAAISVIGMFEMYRAINKKHSSIYIISYVFIIAYYIFIENISAQMLITLLFMYIVINMVYLVMNHAKVSPVDMAVNMFGFFYVGFLMAGIYLTRSLPYGKYFVWLIFISAWGSDTFAYFTGTLFGKHKLTPSLSPNKTVEGAVGGVAGAMVLAVIYAYGVKQFTNVNEEIGIVYLFMVVSGFGAAFSQLGDLTASAIKRYTKIKDYGKIIPGHGGIMDRFDSILFTAPTVYVVTWLLLSRI